MGSDYGEKTKRALKWNTSSRLFIQLYNLVVSVVAARILAPKDFGIMTMGLVVINYANTITNFGFNNALVQKDNLDDSHINSVFTIDFCISILLTGITFFGSLQIASFFNIPEHDMMFKVLSVFYLLTTFDGIPRIILRRSIDYTMISKIDMMGNVFNGIIVVTFALLKYDYWALLLGKIGSQALVTIFLLVKVNWKPKLQYNHQKMKAIYNFGIWNFFRSQIYYVNKYIIQVVTGKMLGAVQLGFFDKAFGFSQIPLDSIGLSINSVMFSTFSRYQKDINELNRWFLNMITLQTILIMPLLLGMYAVAAHFIIVVLGAKWSASVLPMKILCIASALSLYNGGLASLNIGIGHYKQHTIRTVIGSCLLILLALLAVRYGLIYLCIAYLLVSIVWTILSLDLALRHLTITVKEIIVSVFPYLFANFIMLAFVLFLSSNVLVEKNVINLIFITVSGSLLYSILTVLINLSKNRKLLYPIKV